MTHLPPQKDPTPSALPDTLKHFAGFLALGLATAWMRQDRTSGRARAWVGWYAFLVGYAAFDEWTQPLAGRSCELRDWLADAAGAACGLVLFGRFYPARGETK